VRDARAKADALSVPPAHESTMSSGVNEVIVNVTIVYGIS
jgi:hypothetical protein